ncbi:MAG: hypothetical protein LUD17_11055 [Bacteroidales bacterium]|nr:hypothetical protein [Bacteroidales bacterium]
MDEEQVRRIYLNCNRPGVDIEELLRLCLSSDSGVTIDGFRAAKYKKIDQLEKRYYTEAEELFWAKSQNNIDNLNQYIDKCRKGIFSEAHLHEALNKRKVLAAECEDKEWISVKNSQNPSDVSAFLDKIKDGVYSESHLEEAKKHAEMLDWLLAKNSNDPIVLNGYIQKCSTGYYVSSHLTEAKELLEKLESSTILTDWATLKSEKNEDRKRNLINEFIQRYAMNPSSTAQSYIEKANKEMEILADAVEARQDWLDASHENTILGYVNFVNKHPYCEYREEADLRILNMKGDLLTDMKRYPFRYNREVMYDYISSNALTMSDLVDDSDTLTDRAYSHIKRYPRLIDEQRHLPVSKLENPTSVDGNTDVYFFGVSGSGKTCVLAGLMSLTGKLGFRFDPKGPGGGGNYAMELRNYARTSMLPPATDQNYIQVIDCEINDLDNNLHSISMIEMSGEKTAQFAAIENPTSLEDLGPGASGLLSNDNNKVIFFVIDPTNDKNVQLGADNSLWVQQSDVLNCVSSLLSKNKALMRKVVAIHVILTKSDTLGDYVDEAAIEEVLESQGYHAVLGDLNALCEKYDINKPTDFQVGLFPFCVGKFMPGDVYTFDNTDSLKILRVVQENTVAQKKKGVFGKLSDWFNS